MLSSGIFSPICIRTLFYKQCYQCVIHISHSYFVTASVNICFWKCSSQFHRKFAVLSRFLVKFLLIDILLWKHLISLHQKLYKKLNVFKPTHNLTLETHFLSDKIFYTIKQNILLKTSPRSPFCLVGGVFRQAIQTWSHHSAKIICRKNNGQGSIHLVFNCDLYDPLSNSLHRSLRWNCCKL